MLRKQFWMIMLLYGKNRDLSNSICEAMQVDRGTFYNHIFRKADPTKRMQEREELARQVKQIFDDSDQRFGAEKIKRVLGEYGIKVGYTRVHTLMTEMGFFGK